MKTSCTPRYLRVSLLSNCNLKCSYCRPSDQHQSAVQAPIEKVRAAIRFLHRSGIRKVRFTGGEPTLYKGLPELVSFVKNLDQDVHTGVTSNGILLGPMIRELSDAGLDSVNISLDTLDPARFQALTGRSLHKEVISGIDAAVEHISRVKLNCVLIRGVTDDEIERLILFADNRGLDIRFIEFMPNCYSTPNDPRFISTDEIRTRLPWSFTTLPHEGSSAARYCVSPSLRIRVGFICSVSHPFCSRCDRIRLTADGMLHTCIYDSGGINLFNLLVTDSEIAQIEYEKLVQSKHLKGRRRPDVFDSTLPSFSAMGG